MSAPLSLRVCCLVAMAPALTDPVATQTKLKIKVLDPSSSLPLGKPVEVVHKDSIAIHKGTPNCKVTLNSVLNLKQIENSILKTVGLNSKIKQIKIIQKGANRNKNPGPQLGVVQNNEHSGDQKMNQPLESVNGMPKENGLKTASELKKSIELNTLTNLNGDHNPVNHTLQNGDPEQTYTVSSVPDMVTSVNSGTEVARDDVCDGADIDTEFVDIENEETDPIKSEKELSEEVSEKQHVLERRADRLLKRLRRLQGRQLETHIRNQTGSYVSFLHRNLQSVAHRSMGISGPNSELKAELLKSEDVKSLSTAALVNLVRRIQSTQNQAALNKRIATQKKAKEEKPSQSVLVIDGQICKEANRVSGQLQTNLNHILDTLDSDATESSSGGESCDEDDEYERERKIPPPPLHRRAEWKWASDRAAVACRWTWLQAQVSDLEYRIRQQSDIHKQIRHNKGSVVLGEPPSLEELGARLRQARANGKLLSPIETKIADFDAKNVSGSPCNIAAVMTNVNRQATKLTQSLGNCLTPIQSNLLTDNKLKDGQGNLNGVVNSTHPSSTTEENVSVLPGPSGDTSSVEQSPPSVLLDATCQAARCRPVRSYRKRKLLRTSGLHQVSRKAARLSTVKCHCSPPFSSCPMCGGRYNNSQTVDADTMPVNERVSLLDPSYHPVLSFNEEIPLTIHFEALLKSGDWQNKPPPKATKLLSTDRKRQKLLVPSVRGKVRKQTKYAKGAATALLASAKLRNKYERRTPTKGRPSLKSTRKVSDLRKRRINDSLSIALKQDSMDDGHLSGPSDYDDEDEYANCGRDTLLSSSGASGNFKELKDATMRKRRLESAYDIDNIVIPYSIASATRVVKLEYKEIVTPKWRDITENFEETDNTAEDPNKEVTDETENTSDEFFAAMHDICEIQERKRFQSFIKYPSRRSRGSRNDSGPLTPDTASTEVGLINEGNDSAQKIDDDSRRRSHTLSSSGGSHTNLAASLREEVFRRRSSSASLRRNSVSVGTDDMSMDYDDGELVEPWPVRSFPLSEEEYEEMKVSVSQPEVETCTYFTRNKISSNSIDGLEEETSVSEGTTYDAVETQVSVPESPNSSAGSHTSEDPNDPEWTVANSDKLGDKNLVRLGRR